MKPFLVLAACLALLGGSAAGAGAAIPVVDTATYRADLRVAGTALVKLGTTLERNDAGPALRRRAPALRRLLFSFDRRMYAMSRYRLEDAEVNGHRAGVSRAGLAVSGPMSSFLDAALLDQQAKLERLARTVLARLGAVARALET